jgi:hypothetical protein
MREKYEKFLQFFSILEWDDAGLALDVFDGVSNDEFPISLAVIFDVLKRQSFSFDIQKAKYIKKVIYIIPPLLSSEFLQISQVLLQKYFMYQ